MQKLLNKKTNRITFSQIFNLALFFQIYHDYPINREGKPDIGNENHLNSNLFMILGNPIEKYTSSVPKETKFASIKELKTKLSERLYMDKAIFINPKNQTLTNNLTISNIIRDAVMSFNFVFKKGIKNFSEVLEDYFYFFPSVGTKKEYALAAHLATGYPVIAMSQTEINSTGCGSILFLYDRGKMIRAYLKKIYSLPYSYYIYHEDLVALAIEQYEYKNKMKLVQKKIVNWKNYFGKFIEEIN